MSGIGHLISDIWHLIVSWLVHTRLVNDPFADPGLFVDFRFRRRALLFDLGDLSPMSPRELLRVSHAFVSHAHVDHFCGFDTLLRVCLHRAQPLHLTGPREFANRVAAKLAGYNWNLLDESSVDFAIVVDEFDGRIERRCRYRARRAFAAEELRPPDLADGLVLAEDDFRVETTVLDHGTPCLAFALQERMGVNVWRDGLARLGLPVGPWLNSAKQAVRRGDEDDSAVAVDGARTIALGELRREALRVTPGQRVAYVVDAAAHAGNMARAICLARSADRLYIEAAFADEDADLANARFHLTAGKAGEIAREAGVGQVIPFHHSPRYVDRPELIAQQVKQAFVGDKRGDRERVPFGAQ
jgi:ribonuclease Z